MKEKRYSYLFYLPLGLLILGLVLADIARAEKIPSVNKAGQTIDPLLPLMPRKGDLSSLKSLGYLRILTTEQSPKTESQDVLDSFSKSVGIKKTVFITVSDMEKAKRYLATGIADILVIDKKSKRIDLSARPNTFSFIVRPRCVQLAHALKSHLVLQTKQVPTHQNQLDGNMIKTLRFALLPDRKNYFLKNGEPKGFEYELVKKFAKEKRYWLEVQVARNSDQITDWLESGKIDIASVSNDEIENHGTLFTFPFYPTRSFLVVKKSNGKIKKLSDINHKTIVVSNTQIPDIHVLLQNGLSFSVAQPETDSTYVDLVDYVAEGIYEAAIVPSKFIQRYDLQAAGLRAISIDNDQQRRWAVSEKNPKLHKSLNNFLRKMYKSKFYNIVYHRYHKTKPGKSIEEMRISPYDDLVKKYARQYQFDWRLIVAQIYQESLFLPHAKSSSGAKGLMQITPRTARELKIHQVTDPEIGISAGLKYLASLYRRYDNQLPDNERIWFALASYNAGYERIQDARKFAEKLGYDPDRWFDNVEIAMQKLAKPKNREHTRFGACRCGQTVAYVRNINQLYMSYIQLTDPVPLDRSDQILVTDTGLDPVRSPF